MNYIGNKRSTQSEYLSYPSTTSYCGLADCGLAHMVKASAEELTLLQEARQYTGVTCYRCYYRCSTEETLHQDSLIMI